MIALLLTIFALQATFIEGNFAVLNAVQNNVGSLMGGTFLTLWGSGFSREGKSGSTQVYLGTNLCPVVEYYSSDTKLVCFTPPGPAGTVTVFVQTVFAGVSGSCK